jgi:lipopolysaccharide transport system permease protein
MSRIHEVQTEVAQPVPEENGAAVLDLPETIVAPTRGWRLVNVRELWRFRELIYFLAWRDVKVRYKQTVLGAAWAILQPAMMMVVFSIFFRRMAGVSSGDWPYPLFVFAGLLPWTFFSSAISNAGNSVVGSERLITKIYFPRLAIPFASVAAAMVDFFIAMGLLAVMMIYYRDSLTLGAGLFMAPVIFGLIVLAAMGIGTLLAALNVAYRDFRYVIPFLVQLWMFATPTIYMQPEEIVVKPEKDSVARPSDQRAQPGTPQEPATREITGAQSVGEQQHGLGKVLRWILSLNPMTNLIGNFRQAALGGPIAWGQLALSAAGVMAVLLAGCLYFRKVEDGFADVI